MRERVVDINAGAYQASIDAALVRIQEQKIIERIWALDHTVWSSEPDEISNRLGWLHVAEAMPAALPEIEALVQAVLDDGYTHAVLLGMGGSSLAPEVLRKTFGVRQGYLDLAVLDSTDPGAVLACAERIDPAKTLFIVSTKSGGTVETFSFFKYFYRLSVQTLGEDKAGEHFIAITDPGSKLAEFAEQYHFRACFLNDPNIGGRYSALSHFGILPAALIGVDVAQLLQGANGMAQLCQATDPAGNPAAQLGAALGALALAGRDKATLVISPALCTFGDWVEQLVAESTGKNGQGILPVVGEVLGTPEEYGSDRAFVYIRLKNDHTLDIPVLALEAAGQPVVRLEMEDLVDLGGQFFLWEMATVIAGQRLGIQPFDQPDVEAAKVLARQMTAAYLRDGKLPELVPVFQSESITVYGDAPGGNLSEILASFLAQAQPGAYLVLQAYIPPGDETDAALLQLRTQLRARSGLAVTSGYGPRFLHSTGQLHKGDAGKGLFIQITADAPRDAAIPDQPDSDVSAMSFGVLEMAQALGDRQALLEKDRQVLRFHLGDNILVGLERLARIVEG
jgi:glucose-6-phosphate isomerase